MNLKKIFLIVIIIFLLQSILAVKCNDTITTATLLNESLNCNNTALTLKTGNLNCNGYSINGNNTGNGIIILESDNIIIENCNINGFDTAIVISSNTRWIGNGWGGGYYQTFYPENTQIKNNTIKNNKIGIVTSSSYLEIISNNTFINNTNSGIILSSTNAKLGNNKFYNTGIYYTKTSGNNFCYNNISNLYYSGAIGPKCDCLILFDNLEINSNTKICNDNYNITKGITITSGVLDCNFSKILGNGSGNAITFYSAVNSKVQNCNIENYQNGIVLSTKVEKIGYNTYKYSSYNNIIENTSIKNVKNGVFMSDSSRAEKIINSKIFAKNYSIYNDAPYLINASNNFWGTVNQTQIESKFFNKNNIYYLPYINDTTIDFELDENLIEFVKENSKNYVYIDVIKRVYFDFNSQIDVYHIKNGILQNNLTYEILLNGEKIKLELNFSLNEGDELYFKINPNQNILETNFENNFAKKKFPKILAYTIITDTNSNILNEEIEIYLKKILSDSIYVSNFENADFIINVSIKNDFEYNLFNSAAFTKKPYEVKIEVIQNEVNNIINIIGVDIEGILSGVESFSKEKEFFISKLKNQIDSNFSLDLDKTNLKGIEIYDYMHLNENELYYKTETQTFRNIVRDVLYNVKYEFLIHNISINKESNEKLNYNLYEFKAKNSEKYKLFIDEEKIPIVFAGGLFSDISTWKTLGAKLANQGYSVYLIELTGNENLECKTCYNYDYNYLTNNVYPSYIETILNISNSTKIKYVGHSNGAKVALDSINENTINSEKIDTLILVGIPGEFQYQSLFKNSLILFDVFTQKNLRDKTHISIKDFFFLETKGNQNGKISSNLWLDYRDWILTENDKNLSENINIDNVLIIAGNFSYNNDIVIAVKDIEKISEKINSENKKIIITKDNHVGMSESKKIQEEILKMLRKKEN